MIVVALDTSVLSWFARAGRLDVLERLLVGMKAVTTSEVLDEIRNGIPDFPPLAPVLELPWLMEVRLSGLRAMGVFAEYCRRLGSGTNGNVGEATVLAWAEINDAVALLDEKAGRQAARARQIRYKGSLWLLGHGINTGLLSMAQASQLVDELRGAGAYLPCDGTTFREWAQEHGLLTPADGPEAKPRAPAREPPS